MYPTLADKSAKQLSLYITSNRSDFDEPIKISLNYAPANTYKEAPYVLGDVNEDSVVDTDDALKILQYYVNICDLTASQKMAADVDLSSEVDTDDALRILQYYVGIKPLG